MCVWRKDFGPDRRELEERYLYTLRYSLTGSLLATNNPNGRFNATARLHGMDWPDPGLTMVGILRMELLHQLLHAAYQDKRLAGDFLEAGVWRGGSCIYAKGFMEAYKIQQRVWVVDSFRGLPPPEHATDRQYWGPDVTAGWQSFLAVPWRQVEDHFKRYQLMDESVKFVKGYFSETMPQLHRQLGALAVLRLDGDMYKSTLECLCFLYPKLLVGGYWIIDDWTLAGAPDAVNDFVRWHSLVEQPMPSEDRQAVWFEKRADVRVDGVWCERELGKAS